MSVENVKKYLGAFGLDGAVKEFSASSATVADAAHELGCDEKEIAKTMAFSVGDETVLIVIAGDGKVDNQKYKAQFGAKAVMLRPEELPEKVGHAMGGVCPFDIKDGVKVYLDKSLQRFALVYPAAGSGSSAVGMTVDALEKAAQNFGGWVDIAKGWETV